MASKIVEVPGIGNVEFPDSMSDEQVSAAIKKQISPKSSSVSPIAAPPIFASKPSESTAASPHVDMQEHDLIGPASAGLRSRIGRRIESNIKTPVQALLNATDPNYQSTEQDKAQATQAKESLLPSGMNPALAAATVGPRLAINTAKGLYQDYKKDPANLAGDVVTGAVAGEASGVPPNETILGRLSKSVEPVRALTKAVNPPPTEWNSYIKATGEQAGNVIQHAKENGLPLDSQLDYARAAKSAADAAKDHFQKNVLGPVEDVKVRVGQDYKTLDSINKRIGQINSELRPSYVKKEGGQVLTAVANEADLIAEKNSLTQALHEGIAKHTGISVEDVAALRQRFGAQYTIADQTLAAVNQRASAAGRAKEGAPLPTEKMGILREMYNSARGGREGIADKEFRKVIEKMPVNHSPLPAVPSAVPIAPRKVRLPAWQSLSK